MRKSRPSKTRTSRNSTLSRPTALTGPLGTGARQRKKSSPRTLALSRREKYNDALRLASRWQLTALQVLSVTRPTVDRYLLLVQRFQSWCAPQGVLLPFFKPTEMARVSDKADVALSSFFDACFWDGLELGSGNTTLAGMGFFHPVLRLDRGLHLSRLALKGWAKRNPAHSRDPMPWVVACRIAVELIHMGECMCALGVVLMFTLYLRPGELLDSLTKAWIPPVPGLSHGYMHWTIIVAPQDGGRPAKNQQYDSSVPLDRPELQWLTPLLELVKSKRRPDQTFLGLTYEHFKKAFDVATENSGLSVLGLVPYQCRHGGVSHDLQEGFRSLTAAKLRGRWLCESSLRRYEKHGLLGKQMHKLSRVVHHQCLTASRLLEDAFKQGHTKL